MRVLFDNGVPRAVASALAEHVVEEARDRGWDRLKNGDLLNAAEAAGFDVVVTTDRNIRYQQNLVKRRLAVVVLSTTSWPRIKGQLAEIDGAVTAAVAGALVEVEIRID